MHIQILLPGMVLDACKLDGTEGTAPGKINAAAILLTSQAMRIKTLTRNGCPAGCLCYGNWELGVGGGL